MKSIPSAWTGDWIDYTGRILTIEHAGDGELTVSIKDKHGLPFMIDCTGLTDVNERTIHLKSEIATDRHGQHHLQVEAGVAGIGQHIGYTLWWKRAMKT